MNIISEVYSVILFWLSYLTFRQRENAENSFIQL